MTRALLVSIAVLVAAGSVRTADAAPTARRAPTDARVLELFEQSARAYREGRFEEAVDKLLRARQLKAEPVLLYNLGRAYEALGRPGDAADAYAQYLDEEPTAVDRKAIEGRITTLRAQAAQLADARRDPPAPPPPAPSGEADVGAGGTGRSSGDLPAPAPDDPSRFAPTSDPFAPVPWIVAGAGAAAIAAGAVLGLVAEGRHEDAVADPVQASAASRQEEAESLASAATITLIAGAAVTALGVAWLGVRAVQPATTARARSWILLGGSF